MAPASQPCPGPPRREGKRRPRHRHRGHARRHERVHREPIEKREEEKGAPEVRPDHRNAEGERERDLRQDGREREPRDAVRPNVEAQVRRALVLDVLAQNEAKVVAIHDVALRGVRVVRALRCDARSAVPEAIATRGRCQCAAGFSDREAST